MHAGCRLVCHHVYHHADDVRYRHTCPPRIDFPRIPFHARMSESLSPPHNNAARCRVWPIQRTPAILTASTVWHGLAVSGCAIAPQTWPWWLAGTAINHATVTAAGLWPRSNLLGENWTHLPDLPKNANAIALTLDDGPDPEVTPRVLDMLDAHGVRATFFCIGERALRHPALTQEIAARGHAIENHSQRHVHTFSVQTMPTLRKEVAAAQQTLTDLCGQRPIFFRAPAGLRNIFLEPVLQGLDLRLASWTKRGFDTREGNPDIVTQRLLHRLAARDIVLLHDADAARSNNGQPVLLSVLPRLFEAAKRQGLSFVTLRDAR